MHRPTRQHDNLKAKLERKLAHSRKTGNKAKRWKKWLKDFESLCKNH